MILLNKIAFTGLMVCMVFGLQAQYVPKSSRADSNQVVISKIEIKKRQKYVVTEPVIYCDTLIMHDRATLKINTPNNFKLYANYVIIGDKCTIDARGANGKRENFMNRPMGVQANAMVNYRNPASGKDAKSVSLFLNVAKWGNLLINANGGGINQAFAFGSNNVLMLPYPGSGGDIVLHYYAPFRITKRKRSRHHPSVWFKADIGFTRNQRPNRIKARRTGGTRTGFVNGKTVTLGVYQPQSTFNTTEINSQNHREYEKRLAKIKEGKIEFKRSKKPLAF